MIRRTAAGVVLLIVCQAPLLSAQAAPARSPWRFGTELAFTDISGNRDLQLLQATLTAAHQRPEAFNLDAKFEVRYGESQGVVAASAWSSRLRFDMTPRGHVSPFVGLDVDHDRIRRIETRFAGGTGINLNFHTEERRRTTLALGLIAERENRAEGVTPSTVSDTRFHTRAAALRTLRTGVVVEFNGKYQPATDELSDYLAAADGSLRIALTTKLSLRTRYEWKRDSTPAPGVRSRDDRTLTTGLLIQW